MSRWTSADRAGQEKLRKDKNGLAVCPDGSSEVPSAMVRAMSLLGLSKYPFCPSKCYQDRATSNPVHSERKHRLLCGSPTAHLILGPRCEGSARTFLLFFPSGSSTCSTSALVWNPAHEEELAFPFCSPGALLGSRVGLWAAFWGLSFPSSFCSFWGLLVTGLDPIFCCIKQEIATWFPDEAYLLGK